MSKFLSLFGTHRQVVWAQCIREEAHEWVVLEHGEIAKRQGFDPESVKDIISHFSTRLIDELGTSALRWIEYAQKFKIPSVDAFREGDWKRQSILVWICLVNDGLDWESARKFKAELLQAFQNHKKNETKLA